MSDYASPILGAVGAVIGGYFGGVAGARWGWAIGSTIGGMYAASQQVIPGPKIGDGQKQTSQEGGFRPIVYGRSHPIMGNVIADGGPVIVKKKESQGKGGPKVETEYAYRTYAVGFCEGESTLLQAWRNAILVYDAEDPSMAAENAKFLEYASWYTGGFDQMSDPDLQAIYGAGNTPAFRGTSYMVLAHEDVTDQRGAWSQWQVRVFRGSAKSYTTPPYSVFMQDSLDLTVRPLSGAQPTWPMEPMDVLVSPLGGVLRNVVVPYGNYAPESITVPLVKPLGGELKNVVVYYNDYPPEALNVPVIEPLGGAMETVVLHYDNYQPESIEITLTPLGGALI